MIIAWWLHGERGETRAPMRHGGMGGGGGAHSGRPRMACVALTPACILPRHDPWDRPRLAIATPREWLLDPPLLVQQRASPRGLRLRPLADGRAADLLVLRLHLGCPPLGLRRTQSTNTTCGSGGGAPRNGAPRKPHGGRELGVADHDVAEPVLEGAAPELNDVLRSFPQPRKTPPAMKTVRRLHGYCDGKTGAVGPRR